jgi:diguanylate cyclase
LSSHQTKAIKNGNSPFEWIQKRGHVNGHEVGDLMLEKLSNILLSEMRESDIVSRFGGDEFVIATLSDKSATKAILQRVVDRVRLEAFEINTDKKINITISCGFSSYEPGKRIDMLIQEADSALYDAKRSGRDRVCEFSHSRTSGA